MRIILLSVVLPVSCFANAVWHCTATNATGSVWNWFSSHEIVAHRIVQKQCEPFNKNKACETICFPPKIYWRCVAHDSIPKKYLFVTNAAPHPKQGAWFWTSFSKQIAINGARDACRHNSAWGGCYVDQNACASS